MCASVFKSVIVVGASVFRCIRSTCFSVTRKYYVVCASVFKSVIVVGASVFRCIPGVCFSVTRKCCVCFSVQAEMHEVNHIPGSCGASHISPSFLYGLFVALLPSSSNVQFAIEYKFKLFRTLYCMWLDITPKVKQHAWLSWL